MPFLRQAVCAKVSRGFRNRRPMADTTGFIEQKEERNVLKRRDCRVLFSSCMQMSLDLDIWLQKSFSVYWCKCSNVTLAAAGKQARRCVLLKGYIRLDVSPTTTTVHYHTHVIWHKLFLILQWTVSSTVQWRVVQELFRLRDSRKGLTGNGRFWCWGH